MSTNETTLISLRQRHKKSNAKKSFSQIDENLCSEMEEENLLQNIKENLENESLLTSLEASTSKNDGLQYKLLENQLLLSEKNYLTPSTKEESDDKPKKLGFIEFIKIELTRGYSLHEEQDRYTEKRRKVYAFIRIPYELEKFLFYGFLQCLDSFCHVFTFLPLKIFLSLFGCIFRYKYWTLADTCDVLKIVVILSASWFMQFIDTSALYHVVRGQGVIKLYIFYNMLEVLDKLLSSFGQDILDSLLWTASEKGGKRKLFLTIVHLCFAIAYALLHAILVLLQATTLNVAFFNTYNNSLLTIMMSNNFVELKGSVFKKFAKPNLFQMACSDVRERFHTCVLLIVVVMRIMTAVNWDFEHLYLMLPDLATVIIAEFIVDWLKHAFITKFNEISPEVYQDFTITLAFDVVRSHDKNSFSDFSDQVSRRMGFIPIPISIMLIRVINQSIDFRDNSNVLVFLFVWFMLLATKIFAGVFLHSQAVDQVIYYKNLQDQAKNEIYRRKIFTKKSKSAPGSPHLSLIDFSDVLTQAISVPKTLTASDMLANWDDYNFLRKRESSESKMLIPDSNSDFPRRCQSLVSFRDKSCREFSAQPTIPESDERYTPIDEKILPVLTTEQQLTNSSTPSYRKDNVIRNQVTPLRIPNMHECESLSDVHAYKLLNGSEPVEQFKT